MNFLFKFFTIGEIWSRNSSFFGKLTGKQYIWKSCCKAKRGIYYNIEEIKRILTKKTGFDNEEHQIALPRMSKIPIQMLQEMQHHKEKIEEKKG